MAAWSRKSRSKLRCQGNPGQQLGTAENLSDYQKRYGMNFVGVEGACDAVAGMDPNFVRQETSACRPCREFLRRLWRASLAGQRQSAEGEYDQSEQCSENLEANRLTLFK